VIALGDLYEAAGRADDAERQYALVHAEERLFRANGVNIDLELALFDAELAKKPQIVVANKIDLPEGKENAKLLARKLPKEFRPLYTISGATTEGVKKLVQTVGSKLEDIRRGCEENRDAAGA